MLSWNIFPGIIDNSGSIPQRCINIWSKSASLGLYQAIKKRLPIFKISPYVQHDLVDFQKSFSGNASFAWYLAQKRWPDRFICPRRDVRNMVPVEKAIPRRPSL